MTRLTEEMVIARTRQSDLSTIRKLNCWGSELSDVSIIKRMRNVEVLALSVNNIKSLSDFENCSKLKELYLRKNDIQDLNEIEYLQNLPELSHLWLEENPCVDKAGPGYRATILRALPNLKKLDNIDVTSEEVAEAQRGAVVQEEVFEESFQSSPTPPPQSTANHQQNWNNASPIREQIIQNGPENIEQEYICDPIDSSSVSTLPVQRSPANHDNYATQETNHPPSPKYQNQQFDRSPGSDLDSPISYRERPSIAPSMSSYSMKEYYQSEKPQPPAHYRHSQMDLTEWSEENQGREAHHMSQNNLNNNNNNFRRNGSGGDREVPGYPYKNGVREEWEESERRRETPRREGGGRCSSDSASVVSNAVLNHYSNYHRRPMNRTSNLLSAALCLVKELDYPSLEVLEHAVRCRIDEFSAD